MVDKKEFKVEIKETLLRVVTVYADNYKDAEDTAEHNYHICAKGYILDDTDHIGTTCRVQTVEPVKTVTKIDKNEKPLRKYLMTFSIVPLGNPVNINKVVPLEAPRLTHFGNQYIFCIGLPTQKQMLAVLVEQRQRMEKFFNMKYSVSTIGCFEVLNDGEDG